MRQNEGYLLAKYDQLRKATSPLVEARGGISLLLLDQTPDSGLLEMVKRGNGFLDILQTDVDLQKRKIAGNLHPLDSLIGNRPRRYQPEEVLPIGFPSIETAITEVRTTLDDIGQGNIPTRQQLLATLNQLGTMGKGYRDQSDRTITELSRL